MNQTLVSVEFSFDFGTKGLLTSNFPPSFFLESLGILWKMFSMLYLWPSMIKWSKWNQFWSNSNQIPNKSNCSPPNTLFLLVAV